ncbi:hypothetical protein [Mesorhizobium abyssinicae]|uniref:hypothetical protein n=1 Tax=Mesorhizobium abyssinicae TaxID=1209958 RepID=UPI003CF4147F
MKLRFHGSVARCAVQQRAVSLFRKLGLPDPEVIAVTCENFLHNNAEFEFEQEKQKSSAHKKGSHRRADLLPHICCGWRK